MIHLLTIIGARPQIIKAAALSRTIREQFSGIIEEKILHTGQHYDSNMSQVFFDELGIPAPDYNLGAGSATHGKQTAMMITGIEEVLNSESFDGIVLYGDTNSTLAGAVAASKLHVPIFHVEAGLRSYNMAMPEEVNRIVCDQLSSILFAPTQTAADNLSKEGFGVLNARFSDGRGRCVCICGDVMYDNAIHFASIASEKYNKPYENFVLATVHRDCNTDNPARLSCIFRALCDIAVETDVVVPLHPRTCRALENNLDPEVYSRVRRTQSLHLEAPASFLEILELEKDADLVITDSGGVQKEAFFFGTPSIILRQETEWTEIVNSGAGILADADHDRIIDAYCKLGGKRVKFPSLFGDGNAAFKICNEIIRYLQ